jgi:hypothetical protein
LGWNSAETPGWVVRSHECRLCEIGIIRRSSQHLDVHHIAQVIVVDGLHELAEHLEALALPSH